MRYYRIAETRKTKSSLDNGLEKKATEARVSPAIEKKALWRVERGLASGWLRVNASGHKVAASGIARGSRKTARSECRRNGSIDALQHSICPVRYKCVCALVKTKREETSIVTLPCSGSVDMKTPNCPAEYS